MIAEDAEDQAPAEDPRPREEGERRVWRCGVGSLRALPQTGPAAWRKTTSSHVTGSRGARSWGTLTRSATFGVIALRGRGLRTRARMVRESRGAGATHRRVQPRAVYYEKGHGVERNIPKAAEFLLRAAKKGAVICPKQLRAFTLHRDARTRRSDEVVWRKAAAQGYAEAMCNIGTLYHDGKGVARDEAKAREWWKKAAERGHEGAKK